MSPWSIARQGYARLHHATLRHVAAPNRLTTLANTGATLIWTHLPFYPLLVWWAVGRPIWPATIIFITEPLFFCVPLVSRRHPTLARVLFVVFGIANTLLSVKAFGWQSDVGWFLLPCLLIAATFFTMAEWAVSGPLSLATGLSTLLLRRLGVPLHTYTPTQYADFANLNHWCVGCLAAYLVYVAAKRQIATREPI